MSESLSLSGLEMPFVYRPFRMCKFRDDSHELRLTNAAAAVEGCGAENPTVGGVGDHVLVVIHALRHLDGNAARVRIQVRERVVTDVRVVVVESAIALGGLVDVRAVREDPVGGQDRRARANVGAARVCCHVLKRRVGRPIGGGSIE